MERSGERSGEIARLRAENAMLLSLRDNHTYVMCLTEGCVLGVRSSRSKTGLCVECLDDRVAELNKNEEEV